MEHGRTHGQPRSRWAFLLSGMLALSLVGVEPAAARVEHNHGVGVASASTAPSAVPAADLRVALNKLLAEHIYLAASATGAALGGRQAQFEAAAAALDANSVELSRAIGSAYGPSAEAAFLPLWRSHIGMVVEYTVGKATNDQAKQDKAVADLIGYTQDFGAFLSAANENLPKDVVADLVKSHVLTLKVVIDAQAAQDEMGAFNALRLAAAHMSMIADPLADATAKKFPEKFSAQLLTPVGADIRLFSYQPASIQVELGQAVVWTNQDAIEHTVTDGLSPAPGAEFDSGLFGLGGTYAHVFLSPGEYHYFCQRHPHMQGVVTVI